MLPLLAAAALALDPVAAERFAGLALTCLHQEYPGKIAHVLSSEQDVQPPHVLTPAFYGTLGNGAGATWFTNTVALHPIYRRGNTTAVRPALNPVIFSSGPDKKSGVNLANLAITSQADADDNILPEKLR